MSLPVHRARRGLQFALGPIALAVAATSCDLGTLPPGIPTSEAFRIRHVCADSFVVTNRLMNGSGSGIAAEVTAYWTPAGGRAAVRAPTIRILVPWASSASTGGSSGFRLGLPPGATAQVTVSPANSNLVVASPSLVATTSGPLMCEAPRQPLVAWRLIQGLGITGTVTPASDSVANGSTVSWRFTPSDGADHAEVRLNGSLVAASGSAVIAGPTTLTAMGMSRDENSPELNTLIAQAHALSTAPSPRAAAQRLLDDLIALLDRVDDSTSERLLAEFQRRSLASDADIEASLRLDSLLANTLLQANIPGSPSLRGEAPVFPAEPTTYFVAAGILTSQDKLAATARIVRSIIHEREMLADQDQIRAFVSPTMTGMRQDVHRCIARIFSWSNIRDRVNGFLTHCLPLYGGLLDSNDFIEASSQILKQWFGGVPSRQTSLAFLDSLQRYRTQGYHLLVDAHSQGTMIAREAVTEMAARGTYSPDRDTTCIGVVAMAGPVSGQWPLPLPFFREFATEGDIVAGAGGSMAVRIPTDLTRQRDSAIASVSRVNIPLRLAIQLMYGVQLHDLQGVYLGEAPPRNYLLASNEEIRRECETASVRSTLTDNRIRISVGEAFPVGLYFQSVNFNGHPIPSAARRLTVDHPEIAELLDQTTVAGHTVGDAVVVAHSGAHSRAVTVEVRSPPVLGIGGTYAGTWQMSDPASSGTVSLTIAEAGAVTRNGQPMITGTVSYTHPNGIYSVPIRDGTVALGGPAVTIAFRMPTPEFTNRDAWADVTLQVKGNGLLSGGALLYYQSGVVRESRGWSLKTGF